MRDKISNFLSDTMLSRKFNRFLFYFLSIDIALIIPILFYLAVITDQYDSVNFGKGDFDHIDSNTNVTLEIYFNKPPEESRFSSIDSKVSRIWIPNSVLQKTPICFRDVKFIDLISKQGPGIPTSRQMDDCPTHGDYYYFSQINQHETGGISPYYYPFDTVHAQILFRLVVMNQGDPKKQHYTITPNIVGTVYKPSQWDVKVYTELIDKGNNQGHLIDILYVRPLIFRVITLVIFVLIVIAILFLFKVEKNTDYFNYLLSLLFGLWGIREILIPTYITWPTILGQVFLILYILIAYITFFRYVLLPAKSKMDEQSNE